MGGAQKSARRPDRLVAGNADRLQQEALDRAWPMIEPVCSAEGVELVHLELQREHNGRVFRLYIDKPGGVNIDDCTRISRQVGDLLDVRMEDIGPYNLEVSSPGMRRPIGKVSDFSRFKGHRISIRLRRAIENRKQFTGVLAGATAKGVVLDVNKDRVEVDFDNIAKAQLAEPVGQ